MSPGPSPQIRQGYVTADATITTTTETVAATVAGISTDGNAQRIDIRGLASVLTGTGTTAITMRIRRGADATGALVGEAITIPAGAGVGIEQAIEVQDTPGDVAGQSYVLTVQATAASANGTILDANLVAEIPVS